MQSVIPASSRNIPADVAIGHEMSLRPRRIREVSYHLQYTESHIQIYIHLYVTTNGYTHIYTPPHTYVCRKGHMSLSGATVTRR